MIGVESLSYVSVGNRLNSIVRCVVSVVNIIIVSYSVFFFIMLCNSFGMCIVVSRKIIVLVSVVICF